MIRFGINRPLRRNDLEFLKEVQNPGLRQDKFCPSCGYRLGFLRMLRDVRELHRSNEQG